jgi:hypothetical protein
MKHAAAQTLVDRVLSRPPILEATRIIGLPDAEVARLLGCTPMQVNDWAKRRRPIPLVKHRALLQFAIVLTGIIGFVDEDPPEGPYARRAQLLHDAVESSTALAADELPDDLPDHVHAAGEDLCRQMLAKLEAAAAA